MSAGLTAERPRRWPARKPRSRPSKGLILVVDDEPELCRALSKLLNRNGYEVLTAGDGEEALALLRQHDVHLVLSDLIMPRMGGLDLLKAAKVLAPATEFVIITGHGTIETAVDAMKIGAYDFLEKPFSTATTLNTVRKALEKQQLLAENQELRRQLEEIQGQHDIIGRSEIMRQTVETARQVATSKATVLLTGASGTGKEVFANAIHRWSERRSRTLVKVSCAALPETLLEAELFGYETGAFTGAVGRRQGRFDLAQGGTLFLDEVGEMTLTTQVKLLRVLQEGVFERLGSNTPIKADVRLLAATNASLPELVVKGRFREDLYYRLNVINIELPPLSARGEDVILLANRFLQVYNQKNGKNLRGFTKAGHGGPDPLLLARQRARAGELRRAGGRPGQGDLRRRRRAAAVGALGQAPVRADHPADGHHAQAGGDAAARGHPREHRRRQGDRGEDPRHRRADHLPEAQVRSTPRG